MLPEKVVSAVRTLAWTHGAIRHPSPNPEDLVPDLDSPWCPVGKALRALGAEAPAGSVLNLWGFRWLTAPPAAKWLHLVCLETLAGATWAQAVHETDANIPIWQRRGTASTWTVGRGPRPPVIVVEPAAAGWRITVRGQAGPDAALGYASTEPEARAVAQEWARRLAWTA